jgi:hypothetical protein
LAGINLDPGTVVQTAIGNDVTKAERKFSITKNNQPQAIEPPAIPADIRRNGGLVEVDLWRHRKRRDRLSSRKLPVRLRGLSGDRFTARRRPPWRRGFRVGHPLARRTARCACDGGTPRDFHVRIANAGNGDERRGRLRPNCRARRYGLDWNLLVRVSADGRRSVMRLSDQHFRFARRVGLAEDGGSGHRRRGCTNGASAIARCINPATPCAIGFGCATERSTTWSRCICRNS